MLPTPPNLLLPVHSLRLLLPTRRPSPNPALPLQVLPPLLLPADLRLLLLPQIPRSPPPRRCRPPRRLRAPPDRSLPRLLPLHRHPPRGTSRPTRLAPPCPRPPIPPSPPRTSRPRSSRNLRLLPGRRPRHRHSRRSPLLVPLPPRSRSPPQRRKAHTRTIPTTRHQVPPPPQTRWGPALRPKTARRPTLPPPNPLAPLPPLRRSPRLPSGPAQPPPRRTPPASRLPQPRSRAQGLPPVPLRQSSRCRPLPRRPAPRPLETLLRPLPQRNHRLRTQNQRPHGTSLPHRYLAQLRQGTLRTQTRSLHTCHETRPDRPTLELAPRLRPKALPRPAEPPGILAQDLSPRLGSRRRRPLRPTPAPTRRLNP
jgi:hypothetical protein